MPVVSLFNRYPSPLQTSYSDLKQRALAQDLLLVGSPGSVVTRTNNGREHFYRQFDDADGKKGAEHIGAVDDEDAIRRAALIRDHIAVTKELNESARLLANLGYVRTDLRTQAILVAFANAGLFRGGAMVVGSNAYGVLLNDLGARASAFSTEDIDIARGEKLTLGVARQQTFAEILAASRLPFRPIPSFGRKEPSTSFMTSGKSRLHVDLLVPAKGSEVTILPVPELGAHAQALPYLRYLLADPLDSVILGRSAVIPVRVPRPERFAWHKMAVSELRNATIDKKRKDIEQAAVLFAVLAEDEPAALEDASKAIPRSLRSKLRRAAQHVDARLVAAGHARAAELLRELL